MLPSVASTRDRFLKPEGKMLPETVSLFLSLVEDRQLYDEKISRWKKRPYGLDYTDFAFCQANDVHVTAFASDNLLSTPAKIIDIDMKCARDSIFKVEKHFRVAREGICHGLAGWFRAVFPGGIILDTGPGQISTHWDQTFFPIADPIRVNRDEEVTVKFATKVDEVHNKIVHFIWEIAFPNSDQSFLRGDTRRIKFSD